MSLKGKSGIPLPVPAGPKIATPPLAESAVVTDPGEAEKIRIAQQRVGPKYKIEKLLGAGASGDVYKAFHVELGCYIALKMLKDEAFESNPNNVARFRKEGRDLIKLRHRNIVGILDLTSGKDPDETDSEGKITKKGKEFVFLVLEYIDGPTLFSSLRSNQFHSSNPDTFELDILLEPDRAVEIFKQLCRGFAAAHRRHIIHRDIKPENLAIVDEDGVETVKILDFGIAKSDEKAGQSGNRLTQDGMVFGTEPYMAPEQFLGDPHDNRTDIYQLGATMYHMLTGQTLFDSGTSHSKRCREKPLSIIERVRSLDPNIDIPEELSKIIERCVATKPEDRYQSMEEVEAALENNLNAGYDITIGPTRTKTKIMPTIARLHPEGDVKPDEKEGSGSLSGGLAATTAPPNVAEPPGESSARSLPADPEVPAAGSEESERPLPAESTAVAPRPESHAAQAVGAGSGVLATTSPRELPPESGNIFVDPLLMAPESPPKETGRPLPSESTAIESSNIFVDPLLRAPESPPKETKPPLPSESTAIVSPSKAHPAQTLGAGLEVPVFADIGEDSKGDLPSGPTLTLVSSSATESPARRPLPPTATQAFRTELRRPRRIFAGVIGAAATMTLAGVITWGIKHSSKPKPEGIIRIGQERPVRPQQAITPMDASLVPDAGMPAQLPQDFLMVKPDMASSDLQPSQNNMRVLPTAHSPVKPHQHERKPKDRPGDVKPSKRTGKPLELEPDIEIINPKK